MDPITLLEEFGIPIAVTVTFGFFIWKQNKYIQDDLAKDIAGHFKRLESIVIKLIDQQKKIQLDIRKMEGKYQSLVDIITKLITKDKDA